MDRLLRVGRYAPFVAVCGMILFPTPVHADIQNIRSADSAVWGSFGGLFYNYKEPSPPPDLPDSEHGWIPSFAGGVNYLTDKDYYLALEGSITYGNANYNGALLFDPTVPAQGTTRETISTVDGKLGKGFVVGDNAMLIPYAEVGFRYWDRNLGGGQVEDYQNFDALGGVMLQTMPLSRTILSVYGAAGSDFDAQVKASPDTFKLGSAFMYKVGGKVGYDVTQKVELFSTLDYDSFHYNQSNVAPDDFYEPHSNTGETALRVGLSYHFK